MTVIAASRVIDLISNSKNPKQDILKSVGDLSGVRVKFNRVLVATYFRPERTAGGIIRPDTNKAEDEWQGKVGLVLKLGNFAFKDKDDEEFYGERVEVGEWCVFKVGGAWNLNLNGYPCRLVRDANIELSVDDPNVVF